VLSLLEEMTAICRGKRGPIPGILPYDSKHTDEEVLQNYLCIHFPHKVHIFALQLEYLAFTVWISLDRFQRWLETW
jgi:hypothetical protein